MVTTPVTAMRGYLETLTMPGFAVDEPTRDRYLGIIGDETALVRVEVRPALRMEELFETAAALAVDGQTTMRGMPRPLELALFAHEFRHEISGAFCPLWLQRMMLAPLVRLALRRGLDKRYPSAAPTAA